ncbi:alpha-tocopherol transfer protein-like [Nephila pilipes]|uniref:Alpha-tocopherol transfer protein-like n=1 Tax=Nephila pilipes TaxID=299642 RepID=A0A8X6TIQ6_NEPPI|nr:alpha-tocopherol transfer protein-like [Nephila pilipes]
MKYLSTWQEGLTPEIKQRAEEELGETPEIKIQSVKELRRLINEEAEFRPLMDDAFLIRFLRTKKYDVKNAFNSLRNYYIFKARYSRLLTDFKPSELLHVFEMNNVVHLPYRHPSGTAVAYMRPAYYNIDEVTLEEIFAVGLLELEYSLQFEASQVCGYIMILDLDKINLRMMNYYASPKFLFRCVRLIQDCVPCRVKGIHFFNEPFYISFVFNIVKGFLSEKLRKRIHLHGANQESLHRHIPADILPEELGGNLGPVAVLANDFGKTIMSEETLFEKIIKYGFHEKRIQHIKKQNSNAAFFK